MSMASFRVLQTDYPNSLSDLLILFVHRWCLIHNKVSLSKQSDHVGTHINLYIDTHHPRSHPTQLHTKRHFPDRIQRSDDSTVIACGDTLRNLITGDNYTIGLPAKDICITHTNTVYILNWQDSVSKPEPPIFEFICKMQWQYQVVLYDFFDFHTSYAD